MSWSVKEGRAEGECLVPSLVLQKHKGGDSLLGRR